MSGIERMELPPAPFNPPRGTVFLNGVNVVNVSVPGISANALIFVSLIQAVGTLGVVVVSGITPGVGFGVVSVLLNTSKVAWLVIDP